MGIEMHMHLEVGSFGVITAPHLSTQYVTELLTSVSRIGAILGA